MPNILIPKELSQQLLSLSAPVGLQADDGTILGTFTPNASFDGELSEEELQRRENDPDEYSLTEVLQYLESLK